MKYKLNTLLKIIFVTVLIWGNVVLPQVSLTIGDNAPAIKSSKWIKGDSITAFEKGKIYVIEFWATWCGPCVSNIPHLTELAHKYKDQVIIIGMDAHERSSTLKDKIKLVEDFVKEKGDKMDYNVAIDTEDGYMDKHWMQASVQLGIPTAFIVGRDSKLVWIGHPKDMDSVLTQIIEDKFDLQAHKEETRLELEKGLKLKAELDKFNKETKIFSDAVQNKDYSKVITEYDAIVLKEPSYAERLDYYYFQALLQLNPAKLIAISKEENNDKRLNIILYVLSEKGLENKYYEYAFSLLEPKLAKNPTDVYLLVILERIYEIRSETDKAIEVSEKILSISRTNKEYESYTEMFEKKIKELKGTK